jgi:hypothetical protein
MTKRILSASFLILVLWLLADLLLHNHFLAPLYEQNASLWRPLNQMNVALVFLVRLVLLGTFVATYVWLVRPRTLGHWDSLWSPHRPCPRDCGGVRHLTSIRPFLWLWHGHGSRRQS